MVSPIFTQPARQARFCSLRQKTARRSAKRMRCRSLVIQLKRT